MCGINGIVCNEKVKAEKFMNDLIEGLEKMEYRGYDSAGFVMFMGNKSVYERSVGRVQMLAEQAHRNLKVSEIAESTALGIAHTRWSTHGKSEVRNSHPHQSGDFFVVHNGIITNYMAIKEDMISKGINFKSDTDTEVICALANYFSTQEKVPFERLGEKIRTVLQGAYSFLLISAKEHQRLVAVKNGAPLLIGISQNAQVSKKEVKKSTAFYCSSDITAIIQHTKKIISLHNGDIFNIDGTSAFCTGSELLVKEMVNFDVSTANKQNYDHFMLKEINEQQQTLVNVMANHVDFGNKKIHFENIDRDRIMKAHRLIFIACGTSYHSCLAVTKAFNKFVKIPISIEIATHFLDMDAQITPNDVFILVSQSGETADTISVLQLCKKYGATSIGVTNCSTSTIATEVDFNIETNAGIEKGVASTKAYTAQFLNLFLFAMFLSENYDDNKDEIFEELQKLPAKIQQTLQINVDAFLERFSEINSLLLVGRGLQGYTCMEGALKIKEINYIHAEAIFAGELKHGPLALVTSEQSIVFLVANDSFFSKSHSSFEQIIARGGNPIVICTDSKKELYDSQYATISVPDTHEQLQGILMILPLQLISYAMAVKKGINPDFPRNLAKSVTVE